MKIPNGLSEEEIKQNIIIGEIVKIKSPLPRNVVFINIPFEISGDWCDFEILDIKENVLTFKMSNDMVSRDGTNVDQFIFQCDYNLLDIETYRCEEVNDYINYFNIL